MSYKGKTFVLVAVNKGRLYNESYIMLYEKTIQGKEHEINPGSPNLDSPVQLRTGFYWGSGQVMAKVLVLYGMFVNKSVFFIAVGR